jgi:O-methyltransferase involved in polyketide biosynthesis
VTSNALAVRRSRRRGDLSATALYTAGVWAWAGMPGAELFHDRLVQRAFGTVNAVLAVASLFVRRPPSLRHSLVQRHVMIDRVLEAQAPAHVLELAAGLSARGVRASADPDIGYTELDRPEVIARKRAMLASSAAGREVLARPNLRLVAGDVADAPLADLVPPPPAPLLVIAEGLFVYLDAGATRRLLARLAALFEGRPGALVFDLVPAAERPRPGATGRALRALLRTVTRGAAFVRDDRTRADVTADLSAAGFPQVTTVEPATAPAGWRVPHLDERTQQLVFVARWP